MIAHLEELVRTVCAAGPRRVAIMFPHREASLQGAALAQRRGLAQCTLIGDATRISALASETGIHLSAMTLADEPREEDAVRRALDLCQAKRADVLVNDGVSLRVLLPAVLDGKTGLRTGSLLSGVSVFELEGFGRLLLLSDGLMVVSPDLEQRIGIVQNAIHAAHKLGIELPRVALLAATEAVDPRNPVSADAAQITVMSKRKQIVGAVVDGPLGFDNAISSRAARVKGIVSDVSGRVDVLIAPDIESGNLLLHTLARLCRGQVVHVVLGGKVPLVLSSPDDDAPTRVAAIALGTLLA